MARSGGGRLHGYVVVDKPAGWTSHDVVARLRRVLGERRVGHAGTLDPAATGVLPVAVGQATKSIEFLAAATKSYLAEITFGVTTDSYDGDGTVVDVRPVADLTAGEVTTAMRAFVGPQRQLPPMHSAIRVGGQRLYDLARRGVVVDREPRLIDVFAFSLIDWAQPVARVCIDCSKGTYVRSLAHDLGAKVGVGAYLSDLVRLRTGPFSLLDAWTMSELEAMDLQQDWPSVAVHPDAGALDLDGLLFGAEDARRFAQGQIVTAEAAASGPVRAYDEAGAWLGIGAPAADGPGWRPNKVNVDAA